LSTAGSLYLCKICLPLPHSLFLLTPKLEEHLLRPTPFRVCSLPLCICSLPLCVCSLLFCDSIHSLLFYGCSLSSYLCENIGLFHNKVSRMNFSIDTRRKLFINSSMSVVHVTVNLGLRKDTHTSPAYMGTTFTRHMIAATIFLDPAMTCRTFLEPKLLVQLILCCRIALVPTFFASQAFMSLFVACRTNG
jgi:hypothetical protein